MAVKIPAIEEEESPARQVRRRNDAPPFGGGSSSYSQPLIQELFQIPGNEQSAPDPLGLQGVYNTCHSLLGTQPALNATHRLDAQHSALPPLPHQLQQQQDPLQQALASVQHALMLLEPALQSVRQALQLRPRVQEGNRDANPMFHLLSMSIGIMLGQSLRERENRNVTASLEINLRGQDAGSRGRRRAVASSDETTSTVQSLLNGLPSAALTLDTLTERVQNVPSFVGQPQPPNNDQYHIPSLFIGILLGMATVDHMGSYKILTTRGR